MSAEHRLVSDPWFDSKGQMNDEEPATPEEVQALKDYLSKSIPAFEAASRIMTMDDTRIPLSGKDNRVAWLIFDAMMDFPNEQMTLFDLVDIIPTLSPDDVGLTDDIKERYPRWQQGLSFDRVAQWQRWLSFDKFEGLVEDMRRSYWAYRTSPKEEDDDPKECYRRWAGINALTARWHMHFKEPRGWPTYGLSIIREGLEQESWKHSKPGERPDTVAILDAEIPAAVQWILIAGSELYSLVDRTDQIDAIPPSDLWTSEAPGLQRERWNLWKARLMWVQEQGELNGATKALAKQALEKMEKLEEK